jgi:hypothetical protein
MKISVRVDSVAVTQPDGAGGKARINDGGETRHERRWFTGSLSK